MVSHGSTTGVGLAADAIYGAGTGLELTKSWSVVGGFEHRWTPTWKTSLYGTYGEVDYNSIAEVILGSAVGTTHDWSSTRSARGPCGRRWRTSI